MDNKCRFIEGVNSNEIILREKTKVQIVARLVELGFATDSQVSASKNEGSGPSDSQSFDYLLGMPLYSLTKEKVEELRSKIQKKRYDITSLEGQAIEQLWLHDLDKVEQVYRKDLQDRGYSDRSNSANGLRNDTSYRNQ